jgi:hypothetical protein
MPKGRLPKPAHMRQNRTKKIGATTLQNPDTSDQPKRRKTPPLQNPDPDHRVFHELTIAWWKRVWKSPMVSEYLPTDIDGLARLAILVDDYYKNPHKEVLAEIRLQEARFGLSPIDRSRLQWEIGKGEEAERKRKPQRQQQVEPSPADPRGILGVVK